MGGPAHEADRDRVRALVAFPHLGYADSAAAAARQADAVLVVTAWPEFAALDPAETTAAVRDCLLIDACQAVDPARWRAAGWTAAAPFPTSPPKGADVTSSTLYGVVRVCQKLGGACDA
jgi:UDP-glucose/GDP-mannose dehydrogenase family, UDP binding domain